MLDKKKVISDPSNAASLKGSNPTMNKGGASTAISSTQATSNISQGGVNGLKSLLKAKRQVVGSSMMNLVKTRDN